MVNYLLSPIENRKLQNFEKLMKILKKYELLIKTKTTLIILAVKIAKKFHSLFSIPLTLKLKINLYSL